MEDKIRRLCSELLTNKRDEEVRQILAELRTALRLHIERMRERFGTYPLLVERRVRSDGLQDREDSPKRANARDTGT